MLETSSYHLLLENIMKLSKRSMLRKIFVFSAVSCLLSLMPVEHAMASSLSFSDGFEGSAIDPFWTVKYADYGSVSMSTDQAHSGSQSLMLSSTSGGQRYIGLTHNFSDAMIGSASIWFYDGHPGQQTLYSQFISYNTTIPTSYVYAGVKDYDPTYYWAGSGEGGGSQTSVTRSLGWHHFEAYFGEDKTEVSIDGIVVSSSLENRGINEIYFNLSGPYWRPNAKFYFDDFQVNVNPVPIPVTVPEPAIPPLLGSGLFGFIWMRRKNNWNQS